MRILLDACVPLDFRHALPDLDVTTARYAGLNTLSNGKLLAAMIGRFDVLITTDRKLRYQQKIEDSGIAVIVLRAPSNRLSDLLPLVPALRAILPDLKAGQVKEIEAPAS